MEKKAKVVLVCKECNKEFLHVADKVGRYPSKCPSCRTDSSWVFVGEEVTSLGVVMIYKKKDKIRKILKES